MMNPAGEPLDPSIVRNVIEKGITLLERKCIRLNGRDTNWRALFSEQLEDITRAGSPAEFESRVNALIARGGLSHVAFFHQSAQRAPARYSINATFCAFDTPQGSRWLFEDVHEGGPAYVAGVRAGDILLSANGRQIQPPELPTFALGTDAQLTIESADGQPRQIQVVLPKAEPGKRRRSRQWRSPRASQHE